MIEVVMNTSNVRKSKCSKVADDSVIVMAMADCFNMTALVCLVQKNIMNTNSFRL